MDDFEGDEEVDWSENKNGGEGILSPFYVRRPYPKFVCLSVSRVDGRK